MRATSEGGEPRAQTAHSDPWRALLVLPLLLTGVVASFLLCLPTRLMASEYHPAALGENWNSDNARPDPQYWPFALLVAAMGLGIAALLVVVLRNDVRWRRVSAGLLLAGLLVLGGRAVAERPEQRCAHDVYARDPQEECVSGNVAALADVLVLLPAYVPVLALGLPAKARRQRAPSVGPRTTAIPG